MSTIDSAAELKRVECASAWLHESAPGYAPPMTALVADASSRRYFRVMVAEQSYLLMDAPVREHKNELFIQIAGLLRDAGLHAPEILAYNKTEGFMLIEDLGNDLYRELINESSADEIFTEAFVSLQTMALQVPTNGLPAYDRNRLVEELELFPAWWLGRHKGIELSCGQDDIWQSMCTQLLVSAAAQPQVFVHRDFHSCNLLKTKLNSPGIIDFQDAVRGPVSYDLVSILWDRYITWPRERMEQWIEDYRVLLGLKVGRENWLRHCDWMALQRNLKIVGIFARLHYRDNKSGYLQMTPRFYDYCQDILGRYEEFTEFSELLEELQCAP